MLGRHNIIAPEIKIYNAPKPKRTWTEFFATAAYWIFPPTLVLGLIRICANKLFGQSIGKKILPSCSMPAHAAASPFLREKFIESIKGSLCRLERYKVKTHDNAVIDTLELRWASKAYNDDIDTDADDEDSLATVINANPNDRIHIINFLDNQASCENILEEMEDDVAELGANVIAFNYRGVGLSTGKLRSKDDLVTDGIAQVRRLLSRGVEPERIILKGRGLGAGIATLVASHFHERDRKINLFSSMSFSTLTNYYVGQIRTGGGPGHRESFGRKILGFLAKPFIKLKLYLTSWEIDAASAYESLPESHKEYMLVRSRRSQRTPDRRDDPVVTHYASLHAALKSQRSTVKNNLAQASEKIITARDNAYIAQEHLQQSLNAINEARSRLRERKMEPKADEDNGHAAEMDSLMTRSGLQANLFFQQFVDRAVVHHSHGNIRHPRCA